MRSSRLASAIASAVLVAALAISPAQSVEPDEILSDPALESRARDISKTLRCVVCRNQNIDSSDAGLAKDLRVLVRERLVEGDSNEAVLDYVVDRYGEYVLLKPRFTLGNAMLYLGGPLLLILGGVAFWRMTRRPASRASETIAEPLSEIERRRIAALLEDDR